MRIYICGLAPRWCESFRLFAIENTTGWKFYSINVSVSARSHSDFDFGTLGTGQANWDDGISMKHAL